MPPAMPPAMPPWRPTPNWSPRPTARCTKRSASAGTASQCPRARSRFDRLVGRPSPPSPPPPPDLQARGRPAAIRESDLLERTDVGPLDRPTLNQPACSERQARGTRSRYYLRRPSGGCRSRLGAIDKPPRRETIEPPEPELVHSLE